MADRIEGVFVGKPWDRQPAETNMAYHAFVTYRDMGKDRSLSKVQARLDEEREARERATAPPAEPGGSTDAQARPPEAPRPARKKRISTNLAQWSSRFHWQARILAWEEELARQRQQQTLAELEAMGLRHVQAGTLLQGLAIRRINELARSMSDPKAQQSLTVREAKELLDLGIRIERIGRGEPADGSSNREPSSLPPEVDQALERATDAQLRELQRAFSSLYDVPPEGGAAPQGGPAPV